MMTRQPSQRQLKVAEEIRHILAFIFQRAPAPDILLQDVNITVTEVRMSPDLKNAKVYVMPIEKDKESIIDILNKKSPYYRSKVARELTIKFTPALQFFIDETFDRVSRIDYLLKLSQRPLEDKKI